jgi:hypothetical protein
MKLWIIRDKILKFLCQNKENREKKEILEDIKKAKQIFLKEEARFMCHCFSKVNPIKYGVIEDIRKIIPEFKPTTFLVNFNPDNYFRAWWPITDRESRIKAFDKLIEIYSK